MKIKQLVYILLIGSSIGCVESKSSKVKSEDSVEKPPSESTDTKQVDEKGLAKTLGETGLDAEQAAKLSETLVKTSKEKLKPIGNVFFVSRGLVGGASFGVSRGYIPLDTYQHGVKLDRNDVMFLTSAGFQGGVTLGKLWFFAFDNPAMEEFDPIGPTVGFRSNGLGLLGTATLGGNFFLGTRGILLSLSAGLEAGANSNSIKIEPAKTQK